MIFGKVELDHFACNIMHRGRMSEQFGKTGRKGAGTLSKSNSEKQRSKDISLSICELVRFRSVSTFLIRFVSVCSLFFTAVILF